MAARGRHLPPLPPHHRGPPPPRRRLRGAAQSAPLRCRRPPLGQGAARSRGGETTLLKVDAVLALEPLVFAHAAAARQAVLAGTIAGAVLAAPDAILALRDGRPRGIGVARPQRSLLFPEVSTLAEQGL